MLRGPLSGTPNARPEQADLGSMNEGVQVRGRHLSPARGVDAGHHSLPRHVNALVASPCVGHDPAQLNLTRGLVTLLVLRRSNEKTMIYFEWEREGEGGRDTEKEKEDFGPASRIFVWLRF